jgi:myo-inositol-1(or 4)-monophosphatase
MNAPLIKKRPGNEADPVAAGAGGRNLDWEHLSHADTVVGALLEAVRTAGDLALGYFRPGEKTSAEVTKKSGGSPVTEADHAVNLHLEQRLRAILPEAGWLSEESEDSSARLDQELVLIVDPIDGTRSFVAGERGWAISVGLVFQNRPVIGIVHAPALGETYVAVKNAGACLNGQEIRVSGCSRLDASARLAGPLVLAQELREAGLEFALLPKIPSLALRITKVAAGGLDAALVSANSHDWDIAAADLIMEEAGGRLATLQGGQILYNCAVTRHGELAAATLPILAEIAASVLRARAR